MGKSRRGIFGQVGYSNTKLFLGQCPKIDKEIRKLVDEGYNEAKKILSEKLRIFIK